MKNRSENERVYIKHFAEVEIVNHSESDMRLSSVGHHHNSGDIWPSASRDGLIVRSTGAGSGRRKAASYLRSTFRFACRPKKGSVGQNVDLRSAYYGDSVLFPALAERNSSSIDASFRTHKFAKTRSFVRNGGNPQ